MIRINSKMILVLAMVLAALPAFAASTLTPHTAEYRVRILVLGGKLNTRFETTEAGYYAESVIKATGMSRLIAGGAIREKSWFAERDGKILPMQYLSTDTLSDDQGVVDLDFNWYLREVSGLIDGEDFQAPLDDYVHDRVSLQYGLMYDLLNGGEREKYLLQDAEELKPLLISNVGTKAVEVPYGKFDVVGIRHQREGSSRVTTLWCAKELQYLPIVIEQHRKGKLRMRAQLTKYQPLAPGP